MDRGGRTLLRLRRRTAHGQGCRRGVAHHFSGASREERRANQRVRREIEERKTLQTRRILRIAQSFKAGRLVAKRPSPVVRTKEWFCRPSRDWLANHDPPSV